MAKRIDIGEKSFRLRRGVLVEIPKKWIGKTLSPQSKRKRDSKFSRKSIVDRPKFRWNEMGTKPETKRTCCEKYNRYKRGEDVFDEANEFEEQVEK